VLFLIRAEALGDREADALRRFVTGGGTLIADVRPGIYDEHCRPRPHGVLDDLFQVTRTGQGKAVKAGRSGLLTDPSVAAEPAVAAGAASGDGDPPLPRMASSGRGKAILWNFSAMSLPKFSAAETSEHWAEWFARPLTQAGIAPRVRLRDAEGRRARKVETIRWQNGDAEIVALFRQGPPAPPQPVTVELACGARYVYDLRNHGFLDQRRKFTATLVANRPAWFMLTGKPVPRVRIALDRTTAQRGHVVRATVSVPEAKGLHALRIRAVADGWPLPWLDQVLLAGPEPRVLDFPIAYNDPLGSYVFRAIDLVADQTATAELKVDR
jgi:hypothetical protein